MASNTTIVDLKWMSKGGLLLDASGDIAFTDSSFESVQDMVVTRLQAALNGWQRYSIGADLENTIGNSVSDETEIAIQKQVTQALTNQFLSIGSFTVSTIQIADSISIFVYIQNTLIASTSISLS